MKNTLKRGAALLCSLLLALPVPAKASGDSPASTDRADKLASLHLFRGTGVSADGSPVYDLDKSPTRLQGLIMLTRLLGLEDDALAYDAVSPFTDVGGDGAKYVAYAWRSGFTNGTTASTFEPGALMTARGYVAFLLRALGYSEAEGDFAWGEQMDLAAELGMMAAGTGAKLDAASLNRGDMVDLSYAALTCRVKNRSQTLAEKLMAEGVFTEREGYAAGVLGSGAGWTYQYVPFDVPTTACDTRTVPTSAGNLSCHVVTVNTFSPKVKVKAALVDNTLGHTAPFTQIVAESDALAVVNANFFLSGSSFQTPVGHLAVNGRFLYGDSGVTSLGIYRDGSLRVARPVIYTRLSSDGNQWSVYEINTAGQTDGSAVLYTPAYGSRVVMQNSGWALTATYGVITEFYFAKAGAALNIPENGYVVYMGSGYASTEYFRIPQIGSMIAAEQVLADDGGGFTLEGLESVISGAPALVRNGAVVTDLETGFTEARFTTMSAPRTCVGVDYAGRLLLVSVPEGATIQQMREAMLYLGCADAFNLDGGASCGLYYGGDYLSLPSRELTATLQVFVED